MNAYYKIYLESIFDLVDSMIIKFDAVADAMNLPLKEVGREIPLDQTKWRYYQHLAGDYHFLDTEMTVTSLDDSSVIVFSKETLKIHKKTRNVYLNNPSYVKTLIDRYPMQSNLVRGILYPIDYSVSINADDGDVLYYTPKYIESQEVHLLYQIQDWIKSYLYRYMMESYTITNELFVAAIIGQIYTYLPVKILNFRNQVLKTAETHSFHIRRYLASHQGLDQYVQYMTKAQQPYLYRNILYIERHTGMQSTFNDLVEHLMTARNLPVYDYTLRQQRLDVDNGELSPEPMFIRTPLNIDTNIASRTVDAYTIDTVVTKETDQAVDNPTYLDEYITETTSLMKNNYISNVPTKIMEAAAIDPEDLNANKLIDTIVPLWAYLACKGVYTSATAVINPINGETWKLTPKELFVLYTYAYMYGYHQQTLIHLPVFKAIDLPKMRFINESEYRQLLPTDTFNRWDDGINFFQNTYYEIYSSITDADDFMDLSVEILKRKRVRRQYTYQPMRLVDRNAREQLYHYSYADIVVDLSLPQATTYTQFFEYLGFDVSLMSYDDWKDLALTVLNAATAYDASTIIGVREIQTAMVRLFKQLSSYTIQIVEDIVSEDTLVSRPTFTITDQTIEEIEAHGDVFLNPVTFTNRIETLEGSTEAEIKPIVPYDILEDIDRTYTVNQYVHAEVDQSTYFDAVVNIPIVSVVSAVLITD